MSRISVPSICTFGFPHESTKWPIHFCWQDNDIDLKILTRGLCGEADLVEVWWLCAVMLIVVTGLYDMAWVIHFKWRFYIWSLLRWAASLFGAFVHQISNFHGNWQYILVLKGEQFCIVMLMKWKREPVCASCHCDASNCAQYH